MRLKSILTITLFSYVLFLAAQIEGVAETYNEDFWEESPTLTNLTDEEKKCDAVFISQLNICTYDYSDYVHPSTGASYDKVFMRETLHYKRLRLNNDKAVEEYNKVYISMSGGRIISDLKARAILKDGKVIEFDDSNKKEVDNYENYGPFTIFALEGIEVGSEIEVTYTIREPGSYDDFCYSVSVQGDYPKRDYHYELVVPEDFVLKTKSYNGLKEMVIDTSAEGDVNRYVLHLDNVAKFKEEDYSQDEALSQRVEFKLFELVSSGKRNIYSYAKAVKKFSRLIYSGNVENEVKKEDKAIKKLIKKEKWDKIESKQDQIIAIEHYLKKNFKRGNVSSFYMYQSIKHKVYSSQHSIRIYARIFDQLNISHEVVLTCNRFEKDFDEDFESYSFLETYLFYFPKFDKYLIPSNDFMRFGLIPSGFTYNKGLFLKPLKAGGITSFYPEVRVIGGTTSRDNFDNVVLDINFDEEFEKVQAHIKHEANGYSANNIRPYLEQSTEEQRDELLEAYLKSFAEDAEITNKTSSSEEMEGYMLEKPFIYEGDAESSSLIEKAGKKFLFKIGLVIGTQVEMYQDTARQFDVANTYNHGYKRVINIEIPDGYKITNLDDLKMDFSSSKDGDKTMGFTSEYELNGNKLTVTCVEYYNEINIPIKRYEEFRTVINAAADFNKITLVFEKK